MGYKAPLPTEGKWERGRGGREKEKKAQIKEGKKKKERKNEGDK